MYNMALLDQQPKPKERGKTCWKFEIIDKSEPLLIAGIIIGASGFAMALVAGSTGLVVATGVVTISSFVAEWRVRALGIAKKLMDSVHDLQDENEKLKTEVEKFENIVGLLDDNVGDIEVVKDQLFQLYDQYQKENFKQQSNNLLTLFGLVDKNEDSKLSPRELQRLREYIKIVYKEDIDFDILDKDDDGFVSLEEFFEKFRNKLPTPAKDNRVMFNTVV